MKKAKTSHDVLMNLKCRNGISTMELMENFPGGKQAVTEVALTDLPVPVLKELIQEHELLMKVLELKRRYEV